ncbi:MAG: lipopolysaccharide biosynthesis protein RfbH, partial [Candidatus Micrarchaeota archaeon]|nr:lipopolysaccharide biosynthesis protein RfbH [Candidatus Micrarchaeota archaeon]
LDFWLTAGRFANAFESGLAKWWGHKYAFLVNSGSSANLLAASCLTAATLGKKRLEKGDEVITTAASFPTTVAPILQSGATPVYLDTEVGTYNIDCEKLDEAVSDKTRAVMVAHTLGNPFNLDKITAFCKKHNLMLIEDCCDALGATWDGRKVGTFGDMATISFYPAHHITTGEGGAVLTSSALLKRAAESFRDWGRDCWCAPGEADTCGKRFQWKLGDLPYGYDHKYTYSNIGYNLKATDMQAAVGLAQLAKADAFIAARRANHAWFAKRLAHLDHCFILPRHEKKANPSPFGFVLTVREDAPFSRNQIVQFLEDRKIATRMVFAGNIVRQPAYKDAPKRIVGDLSGADAIMNRTFWFGVYPGLTAPMREFVADTIDKFVKEKPGWKKN